METRLHIFGPNGQSPDRADTGWSSDGGVIELDPLHLDRSFCDET